jgi:hypothetical protein
LNPLQVFWTRFVASAWFGTATAAAGAVAGLFGSVYGTQIANAWPLTLHGPWNGVSHEAVVFWTAFWIFVALFFQRQRSDDTARARLEDAARRIEVLVQTLPPEAFRGQFAQVADATHDALAEVLPRAAEEDLTADDLGRFIRTLLRQVAELARVYDDQPLKGRTPGVYAANVMLFVATSQTAPALPEGVVRSLRFVTPGQDLTKLAGALWMRSDLFATNLSGEEPADVPDLSLPVDSVQKRQGRWTLLPGGPRAFATDDVDSYADTHTLARFCAETGDFLEVTRAELRTYFIEGPGTSVRSFISRPLVSGERRLGVLNLHSDTVNILGPAEGRQQVFQAVLTPILLELADAVSVYCRLNPELTTLQVGAPIELE